MNYNIQQQFMNFLWEGIRSRFQDSRGTLLRRSGFQQSKGSICFRKPIFKLEEDPNFCWAKNLLAFFDHPATATAGLSYLPLINLVPLDIIGSFDFCTQISQFFVNGA